MVALRETLLLIHPKVSRSGLDRCLRRHGVSNLKALRPEEDGAKPPVQIFKTYAPGFVHVDVKYLPQMPDQDQRRYLFAAIDRATASGFLKRLIDKAPFKITKVLTDNSKAFTDHFCATGERQPTGAHAFDLACAANHIEHRLIKPRTPQTNGMIERFNGRIADVLATTRIDSSEHLAETIKRYAQVYNQHIPKKALGHIPPLQAVKDWYKKR